MHVRHRQQTQRHPDTPKTADFCVCSPLACSEMDTATVVVTILLAALFTFSSSIKLLGVPQSLAIRDHLGVKPLQWRLIGACELAGVAGVLVGLLWAPIGIAAAIGLALLSIGAIAFHLRAADGAKDTAAAVIGLALAAATAVLHTL
jgi:DoxX-like family